MTSWSDTQYLTVQCASPFAFLCVTGPCDASRLKREHDDVSQAHPSYLASTGNLASGASSQSFPSGSKQHVSWDHQSLIPFQTTESDRKKYAIRPDRNPPHLHLREEIRRRILLCASAIILPVPTAYLCPAERAERAERMMAGSYAMVICILQLHGLQDAG